MTDGMPPVGTLVAFLEEHGPLPETRPEAATAALVERYPELAGVETQDITIDGPHGDVPARLYAGARRSGAALVWLHGGAWIGGTLDMPEAHWVSLAFAAEGIPVLSADYRKALNGARYPVPLDDACAAWRWAEEHMAAATGEVRALYLGGASAGGNLAASAALRLRDAGGAMPAGLVLAYPALHGALPEFSDELQSIVSGAPPGAVLFTRAWYRDMAVNYAGSEALLTDPRAFPGAAGLAGMPPACIINSEYDTIRASGELFAAQLADAGVDVHAEVERGSTHGHLDAPLSPYGERTLRRMAAWMRRRTAR